MGWEPKVGERVGVVAETSRHMEYGKHLLGAEVEVKSTFMSGDVEVAAIEKDGACYCLRTSMLRPLPQKSERELAIDEMSRTIDNSVGGFSDATLGAISMVLYDAGYRKQ